MDVDPEKILGIIFGGIALITWMSLHYGRRIAEINSQKNSAANPAEIHALRHEVASLRQAVGDLMWQMENQKDFQSIEPQAMQDRLTPPEFNKH